MREQGFIDYIPHRFCLKKLTGECPRFRGSGRLFRLAWNFGIAPAEWDKHFERAAALYAKEPPIVLKAQNRKHWRYGMEAPEKVPGRRLKVDPTRSPAKELARQVEEINEFAERQTIEGASHAFFQRVFANGDDGGEGAAFRLGARLYSVDGYQSMTQAQRRHIRINGEETVELDINASFLRIYYAMRSTPLPAGDPYEGLGIPRPVAKAWVLMTFGCKGFPTKWSENVKGKVEQKAGIDLMKYRVSEVSKAVRNRLKLFNDWGKNADINWGVLQFKESNAVIDCVHTLATKHSVLALPVFDSIIVPKSQEHIARTILVDCFDKEVGVRPTISKK